MKHLQAFLFALCCILLTANAAAAPVYGYQVAATLPHSTANYTEGFFYLDGLFYEGTGMEGRSQLLVTQPQTGNVLQHIVLPPQYFGEGIVEWQGRLYQWTWQTHIGFIYDRLTLRQLGTFHYTGEGWGMTHDERHLITSDGSDTLRFRDPATFREVRHIRVTDDGKPIDQLNELEWIHGQIYANIWHSNRIAIISPANGHVTAWIDLTGLLPAGQQIDAESVLNGIAYDAQHERLYVTGKQWPHIYQIVVQTKNLRK